MKRKEEYKEEDLRTDIEWMIEGNITPKKAEAFIRYLLRCRWAE